MHASDWTAAADRYREVLRLRAIPGIQVQLGHALKEMGDLEGAQAAYGAVAASSPDAADASFHRAALLGRLGRNAEAIALLAQILREDNGHRGAFEALIQLGGRDALPEDFAHEATATAIDGLSSGIRQLKAELQHLAEAATFPRNRYDAFRHAYPNTPPPDRQGERAITVIVDARGIGAAFVRETLLSLLDQSHTDWQAIVVDQDDLRHHSVGSLAFVDRRIAFSTLRDAQETTGLVLAMTAGTILDPQALAWLDYAARTVDAPVVYCDSDHAAEDAAGSLRYEAPRLWGVHDAILFAQTSSPPPVLLFDAQMVDHAVPDEGQDAAEWRRKLLVEATDCAHLPRILATVLRLPDRSVSAPDDGGIRLWSSEPHASPPAIGNTGTSGVSIVARARRPAVAVPASTRSTARIAVVIQTRDEAALLAKAVETLLDTAADREKIDLIIVDNRSVEDSTHRYLQSLRQGGRATVMAHDEPFNWSRANNLAAATARADHLVFANNDIEMLSSGWDLILSGFLDLDTIGVVGARMLYPDGDIQHAGILFGIGDGGPVHEGAHAGIDDTGPLDRFDLTRTVAAVTGAFMGVSRSVFDAVGGFDAAALAIGFNDVDFCLSVRKTGRTILYTPAIELLHYESKTRGLNVGRSRVAWDIGEFTTLRRRWPMDFARDPAYSPFWSRGRPFDGYREPARSEVVEALRQSCRAPWMPRSDVRQDRVAMEPAAEIDRRTVR